jgi:lysophospholipase L1-like esterase
LLHQGLLLKADFLACSGDTTRDLIQFQLPALKALHGSKLTTLTIGGDDLGFVPIITRCALDTVFGYCEPKYRKLSAQIDAFEPILRDTYKLVKQAAGASNRVIAVGYPEFFGNKPVCPQVGVFKSDAVWINARIRQFDQVAARAAREAFVRFVNPDDAFAGHRLCDGGTAYLNLPNLPVIGHKERSFHPNRAGYEVYARAVAVVADRP